MDSISSADFAAVERVVRFLRLHPDEVHREELRELRAYLTALRAQLPPAAAAAESDSDSDIWEMEALPAEDIPPPAELEPSPADAEKAAALKAEAADCAAEGKWEAAVQCMTRALHLVPEKAMYWSQRAVYFLDSKRPNAALRDATRALSLNPQNVRALRVRGIVNRHMGNWEVALKDLSEAQAIDYDASINGLLRAVEAKVQERRARLRQRETQEREAKEQEAREKEETRRAPNAPPTGAGMPDSSMFMEMLSRDPELMAAMQDPEIASKMASLASNPMAAMQMFDDPKMGPIMQKVAALMMGGAPGAGFPPGGAAPGGFPSGFPGVNPSQGSHGARNEASQKGRSEDDLD